MPQEFFVSFPNPIKGAPFSDFELEACVSWVGDATKREIMPLRLTENKNVESYGGKIVYSLFGKYSPKHAKKGRECIGDFSDLSGALETMQDMGIITRKQRLRYDAKEQTRELFPDE